MMKRVSSSEAEAFPLCGQEKILRFNTSDNLVSEHGAPEEAEPACTLSLGQR